MLSDSEPAHSKRLIVLAGERDSGDICKTFIFHQENHTLGNSLWHNLLMNPRVVYTGYTTPHHAEDQMHGWDQSGKTNYAGKDRKFRL